MDEKSNECKIDLEEAMKYDPLVGKSKQKGE